MFQIITNVGNGYDARHGEFRAPVDGVYQFSVSAYVKGGQWVGLEIVVGGSCFMIPAGIYEVLRLSYKEI